MPFGSASESSHFDGNQIASLVAVQGTLGTADVGGTAHTVPLGADPLTGALYVNNIGASSSGGSNVNIFTGTLNAGTVTVIGGTFNAGTFTNTGTLVNVATGSLVGTILGGTLQNLVSGTINALASGTITTGTVSVTTATVVGPAASAAAASGNPLNLGGTDSGGTIRSIFVDSTGVQRSSGSTVITTGTIQNIATGTINALASGTLTGGTLQNLVSGTLNAVTTVTNLTSGSVVQTAGTLTTGTLQNLVSGTINAVASGTITGGTLGNLNYGTVNIDPKPNPVLTTITSYGTTGTTGAAVFGTLVSAVGAGTKAYITGFQIVVASGTVDSSIIIGTFNQATLPAGGTNMVTRGLFPAGGGIARDRSIPFVSGTNGTICYWMGGAGTVYFQVDYWASA